MPVSILRSPGTGYPDSAHAFSPSESYPEYRLGPVAPEPNPIYGMVRNLFMQIGLDESNAGKPEWNPLGKCIPKGSRVFILCNFVYHPRPQEGRTDFAAKCIHASVLRALIDYVLIATGEEGSVRFGNSPLQGTDWNKVLAATGADRVADFYARRGLPVQPSDLRLVVIDRSPIGFVRSIERRSDANAVKLDLGSSSLLAETAAAGAGRAPFRISDYDPRSIEAYHAGDGHRYVIHRDILDSDVVVSLSKLKTHEKVGITCGLKGLVGSVGHKDCLAHHRFGNPGVGGDEYPDSHRFLRPYSHFMDWLNQRDVDQPFQKLFQSITRNIGRVLKRLGLITSGAWYGNDTCWRMTLDLARILYFADAHGSLRDTPQRRHLSLIDGIVAGEGNGPLAPRGVDAGLLLFGEDVAVTDRTAARLMGFDPERIPLVREAFTMSPQKISSHGPGSDPDVVYDGVTIPESKLEPALGRAFLPPAGWRGYLDRPRPGSRSR